MYRALGEIMMLAARRDGVTSTIEPVKGYPDCITVKFKRGERVSCAYIDLVRCGMIRQWEKDEFIARECSRPLFELLECDYRDLIERKE